MPPVPRVRNDTYELEETALTSLFYTPLPVAVDLVDTPVPDVCKEVY